MKPRSNNDRSTNDSALLFTERGSSMTDPAPVMADPQLELGFAVARAPSPVPRPSSPVRVRWWFQRMRQIVDRARDWQPAPPPRPEQIWFPNSHREPAITTSSAATQRQICE